MDDYDRQHLGGLARRVLAERPPVADATRELATGVIDLLVLVAAMERGLVGPRRPAWDLAADLDEARQELHLLRDELVAAQVEIARLRRAP